MARVRFKFILFSISLGLIFLIAATFIQQKLINNKRPLNVILISIDTIRPDHMSTYGYSRKTTPHIDKWAQNATIFTNVYTVFPLTAQSFYTLFTGRSDVLKTQNLSLSHPTSIDEYNNIGSLPKILQDNNYKTSAFITNPVIGVIFNFFKVGFNEFNFINTSGLPNNDGRIYLNTYNDQTELTKRSIKWLEDNKNEKFFMWVHYLNPHHPHNPPEEYICRIDTECKNKNYKDELESLENDCSLDITEEQIKQTQVVYDAELAATDEAIGELISTINYLGLDKNTIIILYGDHGEGFDHNIYHHGNSIYDSATRIPLIIQNPNGKKGKDNQLLNNEDILPTLLSLINLDYKITNPSSINFSSSLKDSKKENKIRDYVFTTSPQNTTDKLAVTDGTFKFIYSRGGSCLYKNSNKELYNIKNDPQELKNIINENPQIAKTLEEKLMNEIGTRSEKELNTEADQKIIDDLKNLGY